MFSVKTLGLGFGELGSTPPPETLRNSLMGWSPLPIPHTGCMVNCKTFINGDEPSSQES